MITSLKNCVEKSLKAKTNKELNASFSVDVNGETWNCYTVAVSFREFSLYCEQGCASFVVDSYGAKNTCELVDWENNED
jgi:hypothetical protein